MTERLLFLTGHLAYPRLDRLMRSMGETSFSWEVCNIGVKVAALMTEAIIMRRLARPISLRYQDIAVHLIREAFEQESPAKRAAFWQDAIQPDPALKAIRGRLNYDDLIAANRKPG